MIPYLFGRLVHTLAVLVAACTLSFALLHFAPGDALAGDTTQAGRTAEARAQLRTQQGLDAPLATQYTRFVTRALRGDLGRTFTNDRAVSATVSAALKNSLLLTGTGLLAAVTLGMLVGGAQGWRPNWLPGRLLGGGLTGLYAVPEFVLAIGLIGVLSYWTGWFPVGGISDPIVSITGTVMEQYADIARHLVVPALTLALGWGAAIARQERVALVETAGADFVRTARAKGLTERQVFLRHAVRPSIPAVVAIIGTMLPVLVGGAVVVEIVFAWPGMGSLMLHALAQRDVPVVSGAILVIATMVSASSLCIDAAVRLVDPRQR